MKKIIITIGIVAVVANSCGQTNNNQNNTVMVEKDTLNFELLDKYADKLEMRDAMGVYFDYNWTFTENGTETDVFGDKKKRLCDVENTAQTCIFPNIQRILSQRSFKIKREMYERWQYKYW